MQKPGSVKFLAPLRCLWPNRGGQQSGNQLGPERDRTLKRLLGLVVPESTSQTKIANFEVAVLVHLASTQCLGRRMPPHFRGSCPTLDTRAFGAHARPPPQARKLYQDVGRLEITVHHVRASEHVGVAVRKFARLVFKGLTRWPMTTCKDSAFSECVGLGSQELVFSGFEASGQDDVGLRLGPALWRYNNPRRIW